jgi:hypothetical protein
MVPAKSTSTGPAESVRTPVHPQKGPRHHERRVPKRRPQPFGCGLEVGKRPFGHCETRHKEINRRLASPGWMDRP